MTKNSSVAGDATSKQPRSDGVVTAEQLADRASICQLANAYAHSVDDKDWTRFEALFLPDALIDYRSAGGIAGNPAELAAWMPDAMSVFSFCLHSMSTHEIDFTSATSATGRIHVFNRNGVEHKGVEELVDVGAVYCDRYQKTDAGWRFAERIEHVRYIHGGEFAQIIANAAAIEQ